jgi:hypothetical protein
MSQDFFDSVHAGTGAFRVLREDEVDVLVPEDLRSAIVARSSLDSICIILAGRCARDAFIMAHVARVLRVDGMSSHNHNSDNEEEEITREGAERYMKVVRTMLGMLFRHSEYFRTPKAFVIHDRSHERSEGLDQVRGQMSTAFGHLGVEVKLLCQDESVAISPRHLRNDFEALAILSRRSGMEIYIDGYAAYEASPLRSEDVLAGDLASPGLITESLATDQTFGMSWTEVTTTQ